MREHHEQRHRGKKVRGLLEKQQGHQCVWTLARMLGRGLAVADLEGSDRVFELCSAGSDVLTRVFVLKGLHHFVNSMNDERERSDSGREVWKFLVM